HDSSGSRDLGQDRRFIEPTHLFHRSPSDDKLPSRFDSVQYERVNCVSATLMNKRANVIGWVQPVSKLQLRYTPREGIQEAVVDRLVNIKPGRRDAYLSRISILAGHSHGRDFFHVHVIANNDGGMAAEFHRCTNAAVCRKFGQHLPDGYGTGK